MSKALWFDPNTDEHLIHALKLAYRYAVGETDVTSGETVDALCDALCNLIGDDGFCQFVEGLLPTTPEIKP